MFTKHLEKLLTAGGMPTPPPADPMPLFKQWFDEAHREPKVPNPNAMVLATATPDGIPSARVVLCKSIEVTNPAVVFFTNYDGRKGKELLANPHCSAVFHWDHASRQARIEGTATVISATESDAYFATRPFLSRLGAWASLQSRPMQRPADLLVRLGEAAERFAINTADVLSDNADADVPRPDHWGGFRISIARLELWCSRSGRLHERIGWTREGQAWRMEYLFP